MMERLKALAVARAIYEAAPITGNLISIDTAVVGDPHDLTFDDIEASQGEILDRVIAIAERAIEECRLAIH